MLCNVELLSEGASDESAVDVLGTIELVTKLDCDEIDEERELE